MPLIESLFLEVFKICLGGASAAFVGVSLFVLGQFVQRFVFEPVVDLRKTIGEVGYTLVFYGHYLNNPTVVPPNLLDEAHIACRRLAALLRSQARAIPFYGRIASYGWLPRKQQILEASSHLIAIYNTPRTPVLVNYDMLDTHITKVRENLHILEE